jgi:hypothetical protein
MQYWPSTRPFLEPLSPRQRDSVAAALKQLLLRSEPG